MTSKPAPMERLSTGSAAFDRILGGGLPVRSLTVVAGEPGAGKTLFALQVLFHLTGQGKKCLYFTTLSEPSLKIIRYMQLFSFFDAWNQYLWPLVVTEHYRTVQVGLRQLSMVSLDQINVTFAGTVLAALPLVLLLIVFQKQLVRGLTAGAVKG